MTTERSNLAALLNTPWPQTAEEARIVHAALSDHIREMSPLSPAYAPLVDRLTAVSRVIVDGGTRKP